MCATAVIVRGWPDLTFNDSPGQDGFFIPPEEDIFSPLLAGFVTVRR
jgi:hypothetical protein